MWESTELIRETKFEEKKMKRRKQSYRYKKLRKLLLEKKQNLENQIMPKNCSIRYASQAKKNRRNQKPVEETIEIVLLSEEKEISEIKLIFKANNDRNPIIQRKQQAGRKNNILATKT